MTSNSDARARAISKIQKMLALTNDNATEGEVENAMQMAYDLMAKFAVDQSEIESDDPADTMIRDTMKSRLSGNLSRWESSLSHAVEQAVPGVNRYIATDYEAPRFGSGDGLDSRRVTSVVWYGPADLVEIARNLMDETRAVIATLATGRYGGCYRGPGRSYAEGFAAALCRKVEEQARKDREQQAKITAIVLASVEANQNWLATARGIRLRNRGASNSGGRHHHDAYGQGRSDGRSHDFAPGKATGKIAGGRRALPS